ncbi:hypothetical protein [Nocardia otitidiscaviarum]|uniref:hypothetical protein n=1 Tax=Nocardia otitidiscaviarum TaxID=1823 RepID=UPI0024590BD7|nr:hypothetical protein [Nocardia otitidiscaviarum]
MLPSGDSARLERLTRDLRHRLDDAEPFSVAFGPSTSTPDPTHKGAIDPDLVLWAALAAAGAKATTTSARAASAVLIALIQEWSAQRRNQRVEVNVNGNSVIVEGQSADPEALARALGQQPPHDQLPPTDERS